MEEKPKKKKTCKICHCEPMPSVSVFFSNDASIHAALALPGAPLRQDFTEAVAARVANTAAKYGCKSWQVLR